jgi:hypothetical protein
MSKLTHKIIILMLIVIVNNKDAATGCRVLVVSLLHPIDMKLSGTYKPSAF